MSDAYQAIYDATRSKIQGGDIGGAVENAIRDMNLSFYFENAMSAIAQAASCHEEPSAIYRPKIYMDGDKWCALYGDNLQDGVAGFGDSPALAMIDFNRNWNAKLTALKSSTPADKGNAPAEASEHGYFTDEHGDGTSMVHPTYGVGVFFTEDCRKHEAIAQTAVESEAKDNWRDMIEILLDMYEDKGKPDEERTYVYGSFDTQMDEIKMLVNADKERL